jgi:hypothetical protein
MENLWKERNVEYIENTTEEVMEEILSKAMALFQ